jgi:hypothetical protein
MAVPKRKKNQSSSSVEIWGPHIPDDEGTNEEAGNELAAAEDSLTASGRISSEKKVCNDCKDESRAIFWSFKQGVYFAYKWR